MDSGLFLLERLRLCLKVIYASSVFSFSFLYSSSLVYCDFECDFFSSLSPFFFNLVGFVYQSKKLRDRVSSVSRLHSNLISVKLLKKIILTIFSLKLEINLIMAFQKKKKEKCIK